MSSLNIFCFLTAIISVATAVRFDITNATCANLHGPHCGTYALRVVGTNDTFLGRSVFVGADVLTDDAEAAWSRYLGQESRFLADLTTVGTNQTKNFSPLLFTTNRKTCNPQSISAGMIPFANTVTSEITFSDWAYTGYNSSVPTALANQLFNSTDYGVQVATCYPGFTSILLSTPTVNVFNQDDVIPPSCSKITFEPVCPPDAGFV